jgi:hypothetical protein
VDIELLIPGTLPLAPPIPKGLVEAPDPSGRLTKPAMRAVRSPGEEEADLPARPETMRPTRKKKTNSHAGPRAVVEIVIRDLRRDPRSEE